LKVSANVKIAMQCFESFGIANAHPPGCAPGLIVGVLFRCRLRASSVMFLRCNDNLDCVLTSDGVSRFGLRLETHFCESRSRREMSVGLDWIRTIANFVKCGLDPDCKSLQNLGTGPDLDCVNGKEMQHSVVKRLHFKNILDFIWTWTLYFKKFGLWLDMDRVLKNEDWIWIAKFDSPLISGLEGYRQWWV